jgi:NAD(P)-dependent dehydrogenase (short-subunit alcohol dehydrogenase family)
MNDPLFVIDGRVMLVAGGAGGLGTPLAAALAQRGAKVLIADIDAQRAEKPARELAATHKADVRACALDVVSPQSCAAAVDLAVSAWGRLDGLVNATGIYRVAGAVSSAVANPRYAAYGASKAGVAHLTRVLAVEWASAGVTVNAIGPAAIPTPLAQPIFDDKKQREAALARIPMGRFGTPDDLLGAAIFFCRPRLHL